MTVIWVDSMSAEDAAETAAWLRTRAEELREEAERTEHSVACEADCWPPLPCPSCALMRKAGLMEVRAGKVAP